MAPSYARPTPGYSRTSRKACGYRSTSPMTEDRETRATASRLSEPVRRRWTSARPRATDLHSYARPARGRPVAVQCRKLAGLPQLCPSHDRLEGEDSRRAADRDDRVSGRDALLGVSEPGR